MFKQKRVGIHKTHFNILKFRTMRIDTPKDTPTHLLENPEQGKLYSLKAKKRVFSQYTMPKVWDELMNIWRNI